MIIIVDERCLVQEAYTTQLQREGYPALGLTGEGFAAWIETSSQSERAALKACLVADNAFAKLSAKCRERLACRIEAPVMVLTDRASLDTTLAWFEAGVDDVVRKPVHFRELLARIAVHTRRARIDALISSSASSAHVRLRVFSDGRDPLVDGRPLSLPRRERRVLEHLASIGERRATKAQLHGAVYGIYDEAVEETVIESHVSKLRKKLRAALGYDPIESKRFLGYRLVCEEPRLTAAA